MARAARECFPGRYAEWEDRQRREREEETSKKERAAARMARSSAKGNPAPAKPQAAGGAPAVVVQAKKGPHARLKVEELEKKIAAAQKRIVEIDESMADPAVYVDGAKVKLLQVDRAHAERELQEFEEEWLRRRGVIRFFEAAGDWHK